jgi:hypothetical protein
MLVTVSVWLGMLTTKYKAGGYRSRRNLTGFLLLPVRDQNGVIAIAIGCESPLRRHPITVAGYQGIVELTPHVRRISARMLSSLVSRVSLPAALRFIKGLPANER